MSRVFFNYITGNHEISIGNFEVRNLNQVSFGDHLLRLQSGKNYYTAIRRTQEPF